MEALRIAESVGTAGYVADTTYKDREIHGPAVLMVEGDQVHFEDCDFDQPSDVLFVPVPQRLPGAIELRHVIFRRCRFRNVGFVGSEASIKRFRP